jgi:hypothetical protein
VPQCTGDHPPLRGPGAGTSIDGRSVPRLGGHPPQGPGLTGGTSPQAIMAERPGPQPLGTAMAVPGPYVGPGSGSHLALPAPDAC